MGSYHLTARGATPPAMQSTLLFVCLVAVGSCLAAALPQQFSLNIGFDSPSSQDAPFELTFFKPSQNSQPSIVTSSPLAPQPRPVPSKRKNFQSFKPKEQQQQQQQQLDFQQNRQNFQTSVVSQQRSFSQPKLRTPTNTRTQTNTRSQPNTRSQANTRTQTNTRTQPNTRSQANTRTQTQNGESEAESHQQALKKNELHRKQLAEVIAQHNMNVESKLPQVQNKIQEKSQGKAESQSSSFGNANSGLELNVNNDKKTGANEVRKFIFVSSQRSEDPQKRKQIQQFTSVPNEYKRHLDSLRDLNNRIDSLTARVQKYFKGRKPKKPYGGGRKQKQNKKQEEKAEKSVNEVEEVRKAKKLIPVDKQNPRKIYNKE